ncbi:hypothetical protein PYW08_008003 [Mythimna loreyi]|uniref:Uncharacterized protein n=1 Tax=Mythimna loreyi TaxID=667449 RepID=A0ACC2QA28_9NEOP|nr:hypothetical protein PYW08_008003 [Mythimna loreyi]
MNNHTDPFHWYFHTDDVLILDRRFRDCIETVESRGYRIHMPATKDEAEHQLPVQQANESRKVTMCRWVVETVNGRLKNAVIPDGDEFPVLSADDLIIYALGTYHEGAKV